MTGRTSFRDLLFVKDSQLRNWLPSIRGMIWVSCLKQFCDGWAFAESVICHFSSNHQWGINHYSLLVAKKIQYIAHFSILYRGWKHQIMLPKKRLLAESRQHCFWTKWPKMPTLNLQTVWKCNFCMIWAGRCPKEELVSRVCQNTNLFSSCHGVWAKWEDRKFGENTKLADTCDDGRALFFFFCGLSHQPTVIHNSIAHFILNVGLISESCFQSKGVFP